MTLNVRWLNDRKLEIEGNSSESFFKSSLVKRFFLGKDSFQETKKGKKITYTKDIDERELNDTLDFLKDEKYDYIPNSGLKKLQKKNKKSKQRFNQASKLGIKIKSTRSRFVARNVTKGFKLLKFQEQPVSHMVQLLAKYGEGVANFSVPGAGKTVMTYAAFHHLRELGIVDQVWVIGPVPSFKPWEDEYKVIFGKSVDITTRIKRYHGMSRTKRVGMIDDLQNFEVVLTSYDTAKNDRKLIKHSWASSDRKILLVLDESHHMMSFEEKTEKETDTTAVAMIDLGRFVEKKAILTGTPMPHDWNNLYSQFKFLYPGREIFGERDEYENMEPDEIENKIKHLWTRVSFKQMKHQLPRVLDPIFIPITMNKLQTEIYNWVVNFDTEELDEGLDRSTIEDWKHAYVVRVLQTMSNPRLMLESDPTFGITKLPNLKHAGIVKKIKKMSVDDATPKLKKAAQIAEHLATCSGKYKNKAEKMLCQELRHDGKKKNVLIYTIFVGNVETLTSNDKKNPGYLAHLDPIWITGELKSKVREEKINKFKTWNPEKQKHGKILVATLASLSESVSLHKNPDTGEAVCQHVIYLERDYNAGQYMQSKYRVYRIGSDKRKPIQYYIIQSELNRAVGTGSVPTMDHDIDRVLERREIIMHGLLADQFHLHKIHLEVDTYKDEESRRKVPWGPGESYSDIRNRIQKQMKKNRSN